MKLVDFISGFSIKWLTASCSRNYEYNWQNFYLFSVYKFFTSIVGLGFQECLFYLTRMVSWNKKFCSWLKCKRNKLTFFFQYMSKVYCYCFDVKQYWTQSPEKLFDFLVKTLEFPALFTHYVQDVQIWYRVSNRNSFARNCAQLKFLNCAEV